jgi:hypothetical protein
VIVAIWVPGAGIAGAFGSTGAVGNCDTAVPGAPTGGNVPDCTVPAGAAGSGAGCVDRLSSREDWQPARKTALNVSKSAGLAIPAVVSIMFRGPKIGFRRSTFSHNAQRMQHANPSFTFLSKSI